MRATRDRPGQRRLFGLLCWGAALAGLTAWAGAASGQEAYPTRPVTFLVPYAAGGTTDVLARIVARAMSPALGQTVVVENAGGAGGTIGTARVVRAAPDGYTLTLGNMGSLAANVPLYPNLGFDPRQDLAPVGVVARVPMMLAASNKSGVKDLPSFVQKLKTEGGTSRGGAADPARRLEGDPRAVPGRGTRHQRSLGWRR
jgi:tripartite-type tricarboxylate transporter receptor subunit TctC